MAEMCSRATVLYPYEWNEKEWWAIFWCFEEKADRGSFGWFHHRRRICQTSCLTASSFLLSLIFLLAVVVVLCGLTWNCCLSVLLAVEHYIGAGLEFLLVLLQNWCHRKPCLLLDVFFQHPLLQADCFIQAAVHY